MALLTRAVVPCHDSPEAREDEDAILYVLFTCRCAAGQPVAERCQHTTKAQEQVTHVYVKGAARLRPDLSDLPPVDMQELEQWIEDNLVDPS